MSSSRLLLVEENRIQADSLSSALELDNIESFHANNLADAKDALSLQQFDLVLISAGISLMAGELVTLAKRLSPRISVLAYGDGDKGACDAVIPSSVPQAALGSEIKRLSMLASVDQERMGAELATFDLAAFQQQMGGDNDLMSEIVTIFFEESADQLKRLRDASAVKDFHIVSRLAHSLKGSLGSLHAARARHWAQALEAAGVAADDARCGRCLSALEQSISELEPSLRELQHR
jgi:HPt (histidine-containing phosphotransfer) domain-containing protein